MIRNVLTGTIKFTALMVFATCLLFAAVVIRENVERKRFETVGHGDDLSGTFLREDGAELRFDEKGYFWGSFGSGTYHYRAGDGYLNLQERGGLLMIGNVSEDGAVITWERALEGKFVLQSDEGGKTDE